MRLVHEFIPVRSRTNNQQNQLNLSLSVSSPPIIPQFAAAPRPDGHTPCVRPTATQNENSLRSNSLALPQQRILFGIFSSYHKITVRTKSQPAYSLRQDQLDLQDCCSARGCPTSPKKIGEPPNFSFYCETEWKVVSLGEIFMILQHWIRKRFARLRKRHKAK